MKFATITSTAAVLASSLTLPTGITYGPPPGGWESVEYPAGTGEDLLSYPPPPGGWESIEYHPGTDAYPSCSSPFVFTSIYDIVAVASEVRNGTIPALGPKDAIGFFNFGINSNTDTICYNITLLNVAGTYQSPARTATHIHEAARGASGPPRLVFPNPVGDDNKRVSVGCLTGPFTTGVNGPNGVDTSSGFMVKRIEENPAGFFADSHTNLFSLGVVRGQLA